MLDAPVTTATTNEHKTHFNFHDNNECTNFYVDVAGDAQFTVFMTDYETYAGLFTCQKVTFAHRQSATLLSRTKELDKMYIDKVRNEHALWTNENTVC